MITIRDSTAEDAEAVNEVIASTTATLRQTYRPNRKAVSHRKAIARELHRLVAESEGVIVGATQYFVDGSAIRIIGLGVRSGFRRRGVARALVAEVADRAWRRRLSVVLARTVEETGNVRIFESLGFEVQSRCPDEYSESVAGAPLTDVSLKMLIDE